ncbi:MAG: hypothetical protein JWQ81_5748 [Amycolatopsis sp.]|uniref:hypothetical protein n=1 Tax=Amycolatopsis sp. TaxID=37632 RepID=UPI00260D4886|nr:hypothetical protein [Amycolatopsis sp.]MCU1685009.1 hypothetical protein [Amycolatopsis sp.]
MSNTGNPSRRAVRTVSWLLGGAILIGLLIFFWDTYGLPSTNDRVLQQATADAQRQAQSAADSLPLASQDGTLTDDEIKQTMTQSAVGTNSIHRGSSSIVMKTQIYVNRSGAFGSIGVSPCYEGGGTIVLEQFRANDFSLAEFVSEVARNSGNCFG